MSDMMSIEKTNKKISVFEPYFLHVCFFTKKIVEIRHN